VGFDGAGAEDEFFGDFAVGAAAGYEFGDFALAGRQGVAVGCVGGARGAWPSRLSSRTASSRRRPAPKLSNGSGLASTFEDAADNDRMTLIGRISG
jgi:hypothetical protein